MQAWDEDVTGDVPDKHDEYTSNRVVGTGAAFVCKVQEWLEEKEVPILLAHGSPGVGKTYLAFAVISQHLEDPLREVDGLAYTSRIMIVIDRGLFSFLLALFPNL